MHYIARDRSELEYYFDSILTNNYRDIKFKRQYSYGHNAVKAYVIEAHPFNRQDLSRDEVVAAVLERARGIDPNARVVETQEESLVYLETATVDFYLDLSNRRYVTFHTADPTKVSDPFVKKFYNHRGFDSLWLPVALLLEAAKFGRLWGIGVTFRESLEVDLEEYRDPDEPQDIVLNVQRHFARQLIKVLMESEFRYMMGLSRLAVLRSDNERDKFIIDDIKYNGKLTAKGTSFSRHSRVLYELVRHYDGVVSQLETFGMAFGEAGLVGNPITITFSRPILPDKLIDLMFTAEDPFRLWGISHQVGSDFHRIYAVDMHHGNSGNKLTFEITPNFMRVLFPAGSCANTLLRLLANINHTVDALAMLEVVDYELKADLPGAGFGQHFGQHDSPPSGLS